MSRLPKPGFDDGQWGAILNDYLLQSHTVDGALKADIVDASHIVNSSVTESQLSSTVVAKLNSGAVTWLTLSGKPTTFTPSAHSHTSTDISNSTALGRTLLEIADQTAARTAIGAGTSSLALGLTGTTAAAGDHTHNNYLAVKNNISALTDSTNDTFARINISDDLTSTSGWPDRLAFYFSGIRSGYFNEYGELRARPGKSNTVALRAMKWSGSSTVDIFQVSNTDNSQTYLGVSPTQANFTLPITSNSDITTTGKVTASNIGNKVTASSTAPSSPAIGDVWIDMS